MRLFFVAPLLLLLCGCSMPKHLEYVMQEEKSGAIVVIDDRPADEKVFRERVDSDISYFYGDENFNVPLVEILRNRLAVNSPSQGSAIEITINRITLAASINGGGVDEQTYDVAANQAAVSAGANGVASVILARPIVGAIEQGTSRRSIWCRIDYKYNGAEYSERTVSSAKSGNLSEGIVRLYLKTIDNIAMQLLEKR